MLRRLSIATALVLGIMLTVIIPLSTVTGEADFSLMTAVEPTASGPHSETESRTHTTSTSAVNPQRWQQRQVHVVSRGILRASPQRKRGTPLPHPPLPPELPRFSPRAPPGVC